MYYKFPFKMKNSILIVIILFTFSACQAQKTPLKATSTSEKSISNSNPKLVVGIVVDQMRYDYLTRFYNKYAEGGFKRMMNDGFNCKNNHFNYIPTYT